MPYTVALDAFHGPLDLLLYLVKRNEVDILDIPIARIADQFLEYVRSSGNSMSSSPANSSSWPRRSMEIKSRMLLPAGRAGRGRGQPDPRRELVKQLLEYRKFKDAAAALEERAESTGHAGAAAGTAGADDRPAVPAVQAGGTVGPGQRLRPADARDAVA